MQQDERELARRVDLLRYQVDEIASADVQPGEDEALQQERHLLLNAEQLASATASAYAQLTGAEGEAGALDQLGDAGRQLNALTAIDPALAETEDYADRGDGAGRGSRPLAPCLCGGVSRPIRRDCPKWKSGWT